MKRVHTLLHMLRSTAIYHGEPDVRLGPKTIARLDAELDRIAAPQPKARAISIHSGDLVPVVVELDALTNCEVVIDPVRAAEVKP